MEDKLTEILRIDLIDMWLEPYHGIKYEDVFKIHPEWEKHPADHVQDFYITYAVTEEQHNEWYSKAIDFLAKKLKKSKKFVKGQFMWIYLNVAPSIKIE